MENLSEKRQAKERGVSCKDILQDALNRSEELETVIVVAKDKDSYIKTGYSWESSMEALGMLEIAKTYIIDELTE